MAQDHTLAKGRSCGAQCPHPACLDKNLKPDPTRHVFVYHGNCNDCSPEDDSEDRLCSSCSSLRLRHVLLCTDMREGAFIYFGKIQEIHERTECNLCSIVSSVLLRFRKATGTTRQHGPDDFCLLARCHYDEFPDSALLLRILIPPAPEDIDPDPDTIGYMHIQFEDLHLQSFPTPEEVTTDRCVRYNHAKYYAVHDRSSSEDRQFRLTPLVGAEVNWDIVRQWLSVCTRGHKCIRTGTRDIPGLRVIDVRRRCITVAPPNCRYTVLSYVWGNLKVPKLQASVKNKTYLEQPGSLSKDKLEHTIEDAIQVCAKLGERYLWVDRLCIVQDDFESMKGSIDSMGEIYSSAYLTIVAASGEDADAGLPGVHHKLRSSPQKSLMVQQMELTELMPLFGDTVMTSLWNKRGWTYQERMLSSRALIFTEDQVFFSCQEDVSFEDVIIGGNGEIPTPGWLAFWPSQDVRGATDPLDEYTRRLEEYSTRKLSKPSDAFNAFSGVAKEIYAGRERTFLYGLPEADFDAALPWYAKRFHLPREGVRYPSWSWISNGGKIEDYGANRYMCGSLVQWSICEDGASAPRPIRATRTVTEDQERVKLDNYIRVVKDALDFADAERGFLRCEATKPLAFSAEAIVLAQKPGRLIGRAQTARFQFKDYSAFQEVKIPFGIPPGRRNLPSANEGLILLNCHGDRSGSVIVDRQLARHLVTTPKDDLTRTFEFVALSVQRPHRVSLGRRYIVEHNLVSSRDVPQYLQDSWRRFDDEDIDPGNDIELSDEGDPWKEADSLTESQSPDQDWFMRISRSIGKYGLREERRKPRYLKYMEVIVLLIAWHNQVARRVGLGNVYLDRWIEAEPTWKTIILE